MSDPTGSRSASLVSIVYVISLLTFFQVVLVLLRRCVSTMFITIPELTSRYEHDIILKMYFNPWRLVIFIYIVFLLFAAGLFSSASQKATIGISLKSCVITKFPKIIFFMNCLGLQKFCRYGGFVPILWGSEDWGIKIEEFLHHVGSTIHWYSTKNCLLNPVKI